MSETHKTPHASAGHAGTPGDCSLPGQVEAARSASNGRSLPALETSPRAGVTRDAGWLVRRTGLAVAGIFAVCIPLTACAQTGVPDGERSSLASRTSGASPTVSLSVRPTRTPESAEPTPSVEPESPTLGASTPPEESKTPESRPTAEPNSPTPGESTAPAKSNSPGSKPSAKSESPAPAKSTAPAKTKSPDSKATPESASPTPAQSASVTPTPTTPSPTSLSPSATPEPSTSAVPVSDSGSNPWIWVALAVLVTVIAAIIALVVRRKGDNQEWQDRLTASARSAQWLNDVYVPSLLAMTSVQQLQLSWQDGSTQFDGVQAELLELREGAPDQQQSATVEAARVALAGLQQAGARLVHLAGSGAANNVQMQAISEVQNARAVLSRALWGLPRGQVDDSTPR